MNRLLPLVTLSALIASPINSLGFASNVMAHHTPSHISTVTLKTTLNRQKKKKRVRTSTTKKNKPTTGSKKRESQPTIKPKTSSPTQPPPGILPLDPKMKPSTPQPAATTSPTPNPSITPLPQPSKDPKAGVPSIGVPSPGQIPNPAGNFPDVPKPTLPNVPGK